MDRVGVLIYEILKRGIWIKFTWGICYRILWGGFAKIAWELYSKSLFTNV